jgi:molecular chaperone GrpE
MEKHTDQDEFENVEKEQEELEELEEEILEEQDIETSRNQEEELIEIQEQIKTYKEQLIRSNAELENQRKRMEREIENAYKFALQDFINRMLPAKDSLESGMDILYMEGTADVPALLKGIKSTLKICDDAFLAVGVEEVNPKVGEKFNPELHEAMAIKTTMESKPNRILTVYQKGYLLNGRLIRPARVEVSGN